MNEQQEALIDKAIRALEGINEHFLARAANLCSAELRKATKQKVLSVRDIMVLRDRSWDLDHHSSSLMEIIDGLREIKKEKTAEDYDAELHNDKT